MWIKKARQNNTRLDMEKIDDQKVISDYHSNLNNILKSYKPDTEYECMILKRVGWSLRMR